MSTGESILLIFNFVIDCIQKIYNILDGFEFLPGISYLDFLIAIVIIGLFLKLIRFGVSKSESYVDGELMSRNNSIQTGWGPFSKNKSYHKSLKKNNNKVNFSKKKGSR